MRWGLEPGPPEPSSTPQCGLKEVPNSPEPQAHLLRMSTFITTM